MYVGGYLTRRCIDQFKREICTKTLLNDKLENATLILQKTFDWAIPTDGLKNTLIYY